MTFSGPLPPPQVLGMYDNIIPGLAERLVEAFETQQRHRQSLENKVVESGINRAWYGLWCALTVSIAGIGVAALAVAYQQQWAASIIGGGVLVGLATVFITGRSAQEKERASRKDIITGKK